MAELEKIMEITILAGGIMLRNGAETSRVEITMAHIARALGASAVECFVIPTGIFLTARDNLGKSLTTMQRVHDRTINLDRIAKVNELSRRLVEGRTGYTDAHLLLERIAQERTGFSLGPSMLASGVLGGSFAVLQDAGTPEVVAALLTASGVRYIAHVVSRLHGVRFAFEFLGAAAAAGLGTLLHSWFPWLERDVIIIGGIIPLVPGLAVTNAIRDVIAGDLLSGVSIGMEAALSSIAIAMGVVIVLAVATIGG